MYTVNTAGPLPWGASVVGRLIDPLAIPPLITGIIEGPSGVLHCIPTVPLVFLRLRGRPSSGPPVVGLPRATGRIVPALFATLLLVRLEVGVALLIEVFAAVLLELLAVEGILMPSLQENHTVYDVLYLPTRGEGGRTRRCIGPGPGGARADTCRFFPSLYVVHSLSTRCARVRTRRGRTLCSPA